MREAAWRAAASERDRNPVEADDEADEPELEAAVWPVNKIDEHFLGPSSILEVATRAISPDPALDTTCPSKLAHIPKA